MTEPEIKAREKEIYLAIYGGKCHSKENQLRELTVEETNELEELACRDIIISCLCYGDDFFKPHTQWVFELQKSMFISSADMHAMKINGGINRVRELYNEQLYDFKTKAKVHRNVYTDGEGLSYNSIEWAS